MGLDCHTVVTASDKYWHVIMISPQVKTPLDIVDIQIILELLLATLNTV